MTSEELACERFQATSNFRIRREVFGGFLWNQERSSFFKLSESDALLYALVARSKYASSIFDLRGLYTAGGWEWPGEKAVHARLQEFSRANLLTVVSGQGASPARRASEPNKKSAMAFLDEMPPQGDIAKPIWVHLQPFTFCNLECLHCYCFSSPRAPKLQLSMDVWLNYISKFDDYGIADVFITGGETLIVPEVWTLAEAIFERGMGMGLSTNAVFVDDTILQNLERFKINKLQVSLDGGTAETHDYLRQKKGSFGKTLRNIERLSAVTEPVINTVVNALNLHELEMVIEHGKSVGVSKYKFFPQKSCGRGKKMRESVLSDALIASKLIPECARLAASHGVEVETVSDTQACGAARSGFSVDEKGHVYPCIFGITQSGLRAGDLSEDDIDDLWFKSPAMNAIRANQSFPCHACEHA